MSYKVALRKNDTGEVRIVEWPHSDWDENAEFFWTEGNFFCDCNRAMTWHDVSGDPDPDSACGTTAYAVAYVELPDGTRLEIED